MSVKDFFIKSNSALDDKDIWDVTPWQKDNSSAITKSEVDKQDELSLEDFLDGDEGATAGAALSSQLGQLITQNGIYTAVNNIGNAIKNEEPESVRPEKTAKQADDEIGIKLQKIKNSKLKRVKLSSKFGLYNTYMNLLGNASGLFIGSLGKTTATQIADYALNKTRISDYTLGLGTDSIRRIVKAAMDDGRSGGQFSSVDIPYDDIIDLNLANFFTIYSSRPGLTVRSTNDLLQYVAGTDGKLDKLLNAVGNSISKTASSFGAKVDVGKFGNGNDKSKTTLVNLKQINEFANKYTFLMPKVDKQDNSTITSFELPSDDNSIKKGIIPQNFKVIETDDYKKQISRLAKKTEKAFNSDNWEEIGKLNIKREQLEDLEQQRKDYVKNTIIHSNARLNGGVEVGSLKEYVKQRYDYLKELFPDLGIHYNENGNNIPTLMRQLNEKTRSNGGLYIEPFYGVEDEKEGNGIKSFFIPFEFNPDVQENSASAKYTKDELLGRILPLRAYIGSEPGDLTITTKYIALEGDDETINDISSDRTKYWAFDWQYVFKWDLKKIQYLEGLYRSLTLPYIKEAKFVRPPIIRVIPPCKNDGMYLGNKSENGTEFSVVSDLYSYPNYNESEDSKNNFEITRVFDSDENSYNHRVKRYVATSVQISVIDENSWGNNFAFNGAGACVRKGFKVTITLAETTKNFLDTIPSFASYVSNGLNETVLSYDLERGQQQQGVMDYFNIERVITSQDNKISEESIKAAEAQMAVDQATEDVSGESEEETNNTENNTYTSSVDAEKIQNKNSQADAISETEQQRAEKNIELSSSGQVSNITETLGISYIENGEIKTREVTLGAQKINTPNIKEESPENIEDTVGENKGLSLVSDKKIDVTSMSFDTKNIFMK